jgi:hypothetical protein
LVREAQWFHGVAKMVGLPPELSVAALVAFFMATTAVSQAEPNTPVAKAARGAATTFGQDD